MLTSDVKEESEFYLTQSVSMRNVLSVAEEQLDVPSMSVLQESSNPNSLSFQQLSSMRPHVCNQCGRVYMWKSTLQRHMKFECGKEPNIHCPYCPYRTKRTDELKKHIKKMHHHKAY